MPDKKFFKYNLRPAIVLLLFFTIVLGVIYPGVITFINQLAFPISANGSLIVEDQLLGSELLFQPFKDPKFFWGRPTSTNIPFNTINSSGSNLSPNNPQLLNNVKARIDALHALDPNNHFPIPIDLVTVSGSGLDPHISINAAYYQVPRIARLRHIDEAVVFNIVNESIEYRQFGFLGEPRVNVVKLNLLLHKGDRT